MTRPILISLAGVAALAGAFLLGRYFAPERVEIRTEVVEKVRTVRSTSIQRDTQTKWRTVTVVTKDGTSTSTTTGETATHEQNAEIEKTDRDYKSSEVTKKVTAAQNWHLTVFAGLDVTKPVNPAGSLSPIFSVAVGRRILGPISVDLLLQSNRTVSLGVGAHW